MAEAIAQAGAAAIVMHMRGMDPRTMQRDTNYRHLLGEVAGELAQSVAKALSAGIGADAIAVDPGLGFGKNPEGNLLIVRHLAAFRSLGCAVALGASRKGFVRRFSGVGEDSSAAERLPGSLACAGAAAEAGAAIVRAHDVAETVAFLRMLRAIRRPAPASASSAGSAESPTGSERPSQPAGVAGLTAAASTERRASVSRACATVVDSTVENAAVEIPTIEGERRREARDAGVLVARAAPDEPDAAPAPLRAARCTAAIRAGSSRRTVEARCEGERRAGSPARQRTRPRRQGSRGPAPRRESRTTASASGAARSRRASATASAHRAAPDRARELGSERCPRGLRVANSANSSGGAAANRAGTAGVEVAANSPGTVSHGRDIRPAPPRAPRSSTPSSTGDQSAPWCSIGAPARSQPRPAPCADAADHRLHPERENRQHDPDQAGSREREQRREPAPSVLINRR